MAETRSSSPASKPAGVRSPSQRKAAPPVPAPAASRPAAAANAPPPPPPAAAAATAVNGAKLKGPDQSKTDAIRRLSSTATSARPKCPRCAVTVYQAEEIRALDKSWHKACLTCTECARALPIGNYLNREVHLPPQQSFIQ